MCLRMVRRPAMARPLFGELPGERLDQFEHGGDFALVARQHHALRQAHRQ